MSQIQLYCRAIASEVFAQVPASTVRTLPACPYRVHIHFIWACGLGLAHIIPIWARDQEPIITSKLYIGDKWAHGLGLPTSNPSRTEVRSPLTDISNVRL